MGSMPTDTVAYMVSAMQKLEYNNYYGTNNYHVTSSKQDVLNYISMTGNNYGLVTVSHGWPCYLQWEKNTQYIYGSEIRGTWHLVLMNACYACADSTFPDAFKTNGYAHRAMVGFYELLGVNAAYNFWQVFDSMICSTSLDVIVNYAKAQSGAPAILWGDGSWNGYAWY